MTGEMNAQMKSDDELVCRSLAAGGVAVGSIYDLVNSAQPYGSAIPVLVRLLPQVRDDRIKEGIARALTTPEAKDVAFQPLIDEFLRMPAENKSQQHTKWTIGNAIGFLADERAFLNIRKLLFDRRHGWPRSALVPGLAAMKSHRAEAVRCLIELLDDEDVAAQAVITLGKLHAHEAVPHLQRFLEHSDPWVRTETKRALGKIERAATRRRT